MTAGLADIPDHSPTSLGDTERVELSLPAVLLTAVLPQPHPHHTEEEKESLTPHIITPLTLLSVNNTNSVSNCLFYLPDKTTCFNASFYKIIGPESDLSNKTQKLIQYM